MRTRNFIANFYSLRHSAIVQSLHLSDKENVTSHIVDVNLNDLNKLGVSINAFWFAMQAASFNLVFKLSTLSENGSRYRLSSFILSFSTDNLKTLLIVVIGWEDYFMGVACLSAFRSKDKETRVGACIVNKDKRIVGVGYNGFAKHCSDLVFSWEKNQPNPLMNKDFYVVHAEANAILNKNSADVKGCTIYTTLFPCSDCAKLIIQSQIGEVVYLSDSKADKHSFQASRRMLSSANIPCRSFTSIQKQISFEFKASVFEKKMRQECSRSPCCSCTGCCSRDRRDQ